MWNRSSSFGINVEHFINQLVAWQQSGYISPQVWREMCQLVRQELLPGKDITEAPSVNLDEVTAAAPPCGSGGSLDPKGSLYNQTRNLPSTGTVKYVKKNAVLASCLFPSYSSGGSREGDSKKYRPKIPESLESFPTYELSL